MSHQTSSVSVTWGDVRKVISRALAGHPSLGPTAGGALDTITAFFDSNGIVESTTIERSFADQLDRVIEFCGAVTEWQFPLPPSDPKMLDALRWISLALKALIEQNFSGAVLRALNALQGEVDHSEILCRSGLDQSFLFRIRTCRPKFARISLEEARSLDEALGCRGEVYFSFVATDQRAAYAPEPSIREDLVKRDRFNQILHRLAVQSNVSSAQLAEIISDLTAIRITASHVDSWCHRSLPTERMESVVKALDKVLKANGALVKQWLLEKPRKNLEGYGLRASDWTPELREQVNRIEMTMTIMAEKYPDSEVKGSKGWGSEKTKRNFRGICECFFGYLHFERSFPLENLSVSLFCEWELIEGWRVFVHDRTGADTFAGTSRAIIRLILPLYRLYFPDLSSDVENEDYWSDRLVTSITRETKVTEWVTTTEVVHLKDFAERWKHQCAITEQKAKSFAREETFSSQLLMDRVISVIEEDIPYRAILSKFEERVKGQPILVLSHAAARLSRQLAQVGLVLATNFRSHVLRRMKCEDVRIRDGLLVELSATVFGCEEKSNAPGYIELARIPGAAEALLHYSTNGRPFLVKGAGAADQGYFLTTSKGSKLSELASGDDALAVLGYGIIEHRYLFVHYALRQDFSPEQIAECLHLDPINVERIIRQLASWKAERANNTVEKLAKRKKR